MKNLMSESDSMSPRGGISFGSSTMTAVAVTDATEWTPKGHHAAWLPA